MTVANKRNSVEKRKQLTDVVEVRAVEDRRERDTQRFDMEVMLGVRWRLQRLDE
jgi:hypothetical protein